MNESHKLGKKRNRVKRLTQKIKETNDTTRLSQMSERLRQLKLDLGMKN